MRARGRSQVDVIEATYDAAPSETAWLERIVGAAAPILDEGLGVLANVYEGAVGPLRAGAHASADLAVAPEVFFRSLEMMPPAFVDQTWRAQSFGICSEAGPLETAPGTEPMLAAGIRDVVNINAYDPSGVGVTLVVPLREKRARRKDEAETWTRVASHITSAIRLRRSERSRRSPDAATAVLDARGRIQHAADGATADRLRESLHDAVLRMERARGSMRRTDPAGAVGTWRPLVDAELTLLDHFERDGKRYVVAVENPPSKTAGLSMLSPREQQVVAMAAAGRANKVIAYELGIAYSTVRVLLARAGQRLGAKSRRELVAIARAHRRAAAGRS